MIVEQRASERRRVAERRRPAKSPWGKTERRRVQAASGRRVADRRAPAIEVDAPELPRRARRHAERIVFVERVEPASQELEDTDTARLVALFQAGDRNAFPTL